MYGHEGERKSGRVKWFNDRKGFGFITLDDGNELFVHYSGIVGEGYRSLQEGQRVHLTVEDTDKGPQATDVTVASEEPEAVT
ncbi:MAG: cold shock domain-containing protein [Chloroflexota bacterium]|nr:cold shock domain-containing protein [Chloroflexota bacterium]